MPVSVNQMNRIIQYELGSLVDCSTTDLYNPGLTDVQRIVVGQRTDNRPGAWEVDNNGLIRNPRFRGSPGNCCGQQPLLPMLSPLPGSNWNYTVTGIIPDGRVISGNAVFNGTPYSASGSGPFIQTSTEVGVYWVISGTFYGRTDSIGRNQIAGMMTLANTWASNNLLLEVSDDTLKQTFDVVDNVYMITGRNVLGQNSSFIWP